jgi:hypothetical protein
MRLATEDDMRAYRWLCVIGFLGLIPVAAPVHAQIPDELLRRLLPPPREEEPRERREEQFRDRREEEFREHREEEFRERREEQREQQAELGERLTAFHVACERGDRRACVRFGILIGENRERVVEWRRERPDFFWWDR